MRFECVAFQPLVRNTLRGFATVRIPGLGTLSDVAVHESHGKRWASPPARPVLDANRELVREPTGKIKYSPIFRFEKAEADEFSRAVLDALERFDLGVDGGEPEMLPV